MAPKGRKFSAPAKLKRGAKPPGQSRRQLYSSSRVRDPIPIHKDLSEPRSNLELPAVEDGSDGADGDNSVEEEEAVEAGVGAYQLLLQSLQRDAPQEARANKRRRVEINEAVENSTTVNDENQAGAAAHGERLDSFAPDESDSDASEADVHSDNGDADSGLDPFQTHFAAPEEKVLVQCVAAASSKSWKSESIEIPKVGKAHILRPGAPVPLNAAEMSFDSLRSFKPKRRLVERASAICSRFSSWDRSMAPYIFNYLDVLLCSRTPAKADDLRTLACLHVLNHVLKTRDRVIKNNGRMAKHQGSDEELELRDQGFTRPKILYLLPTRQACARVVDAIVKIYQPEQQENKNRFLESFVKDADDLPDSKPEDFRELFGGNDDDMFRIGLKFTRKTIRFFSPFYSSDIIVASPLGLYTTIASEGEKKRDHDFLSSVEIVVVDQADALLMQNWDNVEYIFDHLNQQPRESHGCDFSRVRGWYLDGNAKYLRQTLLFSAFNTPELNSLFLHRMHNIAGKARITRRYDGEIQNLGIRVRQTFTRFQAAASPAADPDARFKYFSTTVIPRLATAAAGGGGGTLVFIPSYFDFVRVRNLFATAAATQNVAFGSVSEYTSVREVARARSHLLSGRHAVLLYTERAHHFRRYVLRGVTSVIMYGLPDNPLFYREIVGGFLGAAVADGRTDAAAASVRALFSKWDALKLERIVGSDRCKTLLTADETDTFNFV